MQSFNWRCKRNPVNIIYQSVELEILLQIVWLFVLQATRSVNKPANTLQSLKYSTFSIGWLAFSGEVYANLKMVSDTKEEQ